MSLRAKRKPLTLVDSIRTCLRHGMHSELWLTSRGPTCTHLFVIRPPAFDCLGFALHNYQLSPILQLWRRRKHHGQNTNPITGRKGWVDLVFSLYLCSRRPTFSLYCVSCEWRGKAWCRDREGRGGGGGFVRKRDRKGLKASLWMTKT